MADDVLDHDDRIIDHESGADRQRHQRQVVEAEPGEIHDAEAGDQRQRERHARDQRCAQRTQEKQHDKRDQHGAEDQRELHIVNGSADGHGAVTDDRQFDAGRNRALEVRNCLADLPDDLDHIGAGLTLDVDDDGRRSVIPAAGAVVFQSIHDPGDIADRDRRPVAIGDNDGLVRVRRRDLVVGGNGIGLLRAVQRSLRS